MKDHDERSAAAAKGGRPVEPPKPSPPTTPVRGGPREPDLDLAIDEIAPTNRLKEGFTGQER